MLRRLLAHERTGVLDLDDPATTKLRRQIIAANPFLKQVYRSWYAEIESELPAIPGKVLELGSGAGFLKEYIPGLIATELLQIGGVELVASALELPFADHSLRAVVMTNVLHHLPRVAFFFGEAQRCLSPGGKVIMIEPWLTGWSRWIYTYLHHEPMDPHAPEWDFVSHGPVSGANEALPWIVFARDRARFEREFPQLRITRIEPIMPLVYLLSGGFSSRLHFPGGAYPFCRKTEKLLARWRDQFALFAVIVLTRC